MRNLFIMISLLLACQSFASGGSGGVGGGGGMKPELGRLINQYQLRQLYQNLEARPLLESLKIKRSERFDGAYGKEAGIKPSIYLNIKDISEFTLKDGSVIRVDELLE